MKACIILIGILCKLCFTFPLGANLTPPGVFNTDPAFVDAMIQANIGPQNNPYGTGLEVNANGWPTTDFSTCIVGPGIGAQEIVGDWYVSWIGNATVESLWNPCTVLNITYNPATKIGAAWVHLPATSAGLCLNFYTNNRGVFNITAIRPGYDINNYPRFTNTYINTLQKFSLDTYRFMDWAQTNGNPVSKWSDRNSPTNYRPTFGVPWEYAIELANLMKVNMWVNVPHMADDDYVLQMAKLFKELLDPSLVVYVEYSNELWNWGFIQFGWNHDQAVAMVTNGTYGPILNYDNVNSEWDWTYRRTAWRAMTISNIWREVWGDCAINDRVRVVLAGMIAGVGVVETGLDMVNAVYGPPDQYFYAAAGAPYYQLGDTVNDTFSTDDILRMLKSVSESLPTSYGYIENFGFARYYNLKYLAYEGGPDTFGPNSISAKKNASGDPRMIDITFNFLEAWYAHGGGLFNWFNFISGSWDSQYGTWPVTDDITNLTMPKIMGIEKTIKTPLPAVTGGHILPTTMDGSGGFGGSGLWIMFKYGDRALYSVNDRHAYGGVYNMYFNYTAYTDMYVAIYLNNEVVTNNFTLHPVENGLSDPFEITIPSGLQTVGVFSRYTGQFPVGVNSVQFQFVSELTQPIIIQTNCTHVDITTTGTTTGNNDQTSVNSASIAVVNIIGWIVLLVIAL